MICQQEIRNKILKNLFQNLLYLEHEEQMLVIHVPQSVQKVKTTKFNKPKGIMEQKKRPFNSDI